MQRKALRLFIFLAITSIIGMAMVQAFWFQKAFDIRREGFTLKVNIALNRVAKRIAAYNNYQLPATDLVEQLNLNSYRVLINQNVDANLLPELIRQEFAQQQLITDFEFAIYDCTNNSLKFGARVCMDEECEIVSIADRDIPTTPVDQYYFLVQLPNSLHNILASMEIWIFSTVVLVVVVLFFAYSLFFILKQKKLSEIQADFINNMSHEFQTPISSILLSGKTLQQPSLLKSPEKVSIYAQLICKEGERLKRNVTSILEQADKSNYNLALERYSMHELLKEVVNATILMNPTLKTDWQLEATKDDLFIDKLHVYNAIQNILDNSIKYAMDIPEILIKTSNEKNKLFLSISDNGMGIEKKEQKKVFKKFYRAPNHQISTKKGFGLGLYYVKKIMSAHHGTINLRSNLQKGTTVTLTFNLPKD